MSLHNLAQHIQGAGRRGDSVLVHMSPDEVKGLQSLAMAHGGSLTINPETGLPEAFFLAAILPTIAGIGLKAAGMTAMQAALTTAAVGTLATGSLSKGLMAGLGAYGGAGLGGALAGGAAAGAAAAGAGGSAAGSAIPAALRAATEPALQGLAGNAFIPASGQSILAQAATGAPAALRAATEPALQGMAGSVGAAPITAAATTTRDAVLRAATDPAAGGMAGLQGLAKTAAAPNTFTGQLSAMGRGLKDIATDPKKLMQFVKDNPYESAALAASLYNASQSPRKFPERKPGEPLDILRYEYDPQPIGVAGTSERNYFPNARFTPTGEVYAAGGGLMSLADGGTVEQMSRMNAVGANTMYPMANQMSQKYATPRERPISDNVIRPPGEARLDPYTGEQRFANGGDVESQLKNLYEQTFLRPADAAGLSFWKSQVGETLDPNEIKAFKESPGAQIEFASPGYAAAKAAADEAARNAAAKAAADEAARNADAKAAADAAAAARQTTQTTNQGAAAGTVNIPQGAFYYGGGIPDPFGYGKTGTSEEKSTAVESPFANTTFKLGSQAPTIGAQTTAASPSQVADIYERVLGRQVDLPGLEFYARQQRLAPSALEQTLQYSPEFFTNLAKPLVPRISYDEFGRASIEGAPAYNPMQYGYPMPNVPNVPPAFTTPLTKLTTVPSGGGVDTIRGAVGNDTIRGAVGNDTIRGATDNDTIRGATDNDTIQGGGTRDTISTDPNAYQYNYFENKPEENALIRQYQTGPNEKARADLTELYLTKLGRIPDAPGFDYYMKTIGADNIIDPKEAEMFINNASPELADRRALTALYREVGGRDPDIPGLEYYMSEIGKAGGLDPIKDRLVAGLKKEIDMANAGYRGFNPNQMGSRMTQAEAAALQAKAPFLYGTDPTTGKANNLAREQLYKLYEQNLGRTPDMAGFNYWINEFGRDNNIDSAEMAKFFQGAKESGETVRMAGGGIANLGGYSDGGRLLKGPGDGVSDSIPAVIGERQPARLADGEFVIPARIVSELGNGSTDAGARKLYAMMDRIQRARKKSVGKQKVAVNSKSEKYLPA